MNKEIEVRLLDASSIQEQVEVYKRAFNSTEQVEKVIEYWKRKHFDNPIQRSYVFGVYDEKKLVSINAYMPMRYSMDSQIYNVIQSCESGTIPEYRGGGIWSKVVKYAVNYFRNEGKYDFLIGFPNYENSYGGFMKMKWSHVVDVTNYILIANGKEFIKSAVSKTIAPIGGILDVQKICIKCRTNKKFKAIDKTQIVKNKEDGFVLKTDFNFIQWKEKYKGMRSFSIVDENDRVLAECMYFKSKYKDSEVVHFCNPIIDNECCDILAVYATAINKVLKDNHKVAFIRAWTIGGSITEKAYRKNGFLRSKHPNPFIVYQLKDDIIMNKKLCSADNWQNISFLDLD